MAQAGCSSSEIIVTEAHLMEIMEGVCQIGVAINPILGRVERVTEQDYRDVFSPLLATLIFVTNLCTPNKREEIISMLEKNLEIKLSDIF